MFSAVLEEQSETPLVTVCRFYAACFQGRGRRFAEVWNFPPKIF